MQRHQIGALLGALALLTTLVAVAVRSLATVAPDDIPMRSRQPNLSSQTKATFNPAAASFEINVPYRGSIETPWDTGSLWDEEAPAYDLAR